LLLFSLTHIHPNEVPPPAPEGTFSQYTEESTGTGVGVTVGAQYKINEMWTKRI
jgi:hypothetical protein